MKTPKTFQIYRYTSNIIIVSEVVVLKLRRIGSGREYLYPQTFAGLAYIIATGCMYELRRFKRQQKRQSRVENLPS